MGRKRKISSPRMMEKLWEAYKEECDNQATKLTHISRKTDKVVTRTVRRRISYTIEGFCLYLGLSRSAFYSTYGEDTAFSDIFTRAREECEYDARRKFELGELPPSLAPLWMSKYGYGSRENQEAGEGGGVVVLAEPEGKPEPPEDSHE